MTKEIKKSKILSKSYLRKLASDGKAENIGNRRVRVKGETFDRNMTAFARHDREDDIYYHFK